MVSVCAMAFVWKVLLAEKIVLAWESSLCLGGVWHTQRMFAWDLKGNCQEQLKASLAQLAGAHSI